MEDGGRDEWDFVSVLVAWAGQWKCLCVCVCADNMDHLGILGVNIEERY